MTVAPRRAAEPEPSARKPAWQYVVAGLAGVALLGLSVFYFAAGLVAPLWAIVVFWVIWLGLAVLGVIWFRRHPLRVVLLPIIAAVVFFGGISLGEAFLGWTA